MVIFPSCNEGLTYLFSTFSLVQCSRLFPTVAKICRTAESAFQDVPGHPVNTGYIFLKVTDSDVAILPVQCHWFLFLFKHWKTYRILIEHNLHDLLTGVSRHIPECTRWQLPWNSLLHLLQFQCKFLSHFSLICRTENSQGSEKTVFYKAQPVCVFLDVQHKRLSNKHGKEND